MIIVQSFRRSCCKSVNRRMYIFQTRTFGRWDRQTDRLETTSVKKCKLGGCYRKTTKLADSKTGRRGRQPKQFRHIGKLSSPVCRAERNRQQSRQARQLAEQTGRCGQEGQATEWTGKAVG